MAHTQGKGWRSALGRIRRWLVLMNIPGGLLWALSPVGIHLSEVKFKTPGVFWMLFPSAPLLLLMGLLGLHFWQAGRAGLLGQVGLGLATAGLVLSIAGDVSMFYLDIDSVYIMSAPAYRAFRLGLLILALGTVLFGFAAGRTRALPVWSVLPLAIVALGGFIAFADDLGSVGAGLWMAFGVGWAWLGISLLLGSVIPFLRKRPLESPVPR